MVQSKDSGFHQFYLSLFTLCAVKGVVWFRVLMTTMRETETQICLVIKTVHQRNRSRDSWMPVNALYTFLDRKRIYSHLYRGVGLRLLPQQEVTSFTTINCILLALMHTWQVHMCIECTLIRTYIQYIHCWVTADEKQRG